MFKSVAIFTFLVILGSIIETEAGFGFSTCDVIPDHRKLYHGFGNEECVVFGNCWDDNAGVCYKKIQCTSAEPDDVECGEAGITADQCEKNGCVWRDSDCHGHKCYKDEEGHTHA